jgi:hypothetical protein
MAAVLQTSGPAMKAHSLVPALVLLAAPLAAETLVTGELPCLPLGTQAAVTARVDPPPGEGQTVRTYFRRLSLEVEDFYWTPMVPGEPGNFWGVLPLPEDTKLPRQALRTRRDDAWAAWWRAKEASLDRNPNGDLDQAVIDARAALGKGEKRAWMAGRDDAGLEAFLSAQQFEPAEWFVAVVDGSGRITAATPMKVAEVREDCSAPLTDEQQDLADALTVGETSAWQKDEWIFHWECEHIETRVDWRGEERGAGLCVPVVFAWWPTAAGLGAVGAIVVVDEDPPAETSPSRP